MSAVSRAPERHDVVVYHGDDELVAAVASYVAEGLRVGEGVVVVATSAHRSAVEFLLLQQGTDVVQAAAAGQYVAADAARTLARFAHGGVLDARSFETVIGGVIDAAGAIGRPVRAFGEMVALLWADGDASAAVELEHLWNELATSREFTLLCAYPSAVLDSHPDLVAVNEMCRTHSHVGPLSSYDGSIRPGEMARAGDESSRVFLEAPSAVRAVRSWVAETLVQWNEHRHVEAGTLVASELATNAIRHAGTAFRLSLSRSPRGIRVACEDLGAGQPELVCARSDATGGRGLALVADLAVQWGSEPTATGKVVWADLDTVGRQKRRRSQTSVSPATPPRTLPVWLRAVRTQQRARGFLPRGDTLPAQTWAARHAGICLLLWGHVAALPLIALYTGHEPLHGLAVTSALVTLLLTAQVKRIGRSARSVTATLGLMLSSATVVHLYDGLIEAHFHFFVMVVVASLYQSWRPLMVAVAFVVLHHGLLPALDPDLVFVHAAAKEDPWVWASVHGLFILAQSVACLVCWRLSETALDKERAAREALSGAHRDLAAAQALAGVSSWEWHVASNKVSWSEQFYALTGSERVAQPTFEAFLQLVHPSDRDRVAEVTTTAAEDGIRWEEEFRIVRPDGSVRVVHGRGEFGLAPDRERGAVMLGTCQDVTDRKRSEAELAEAHARLIELAHHDGLTGLKNRRRIDEQLQAEYGSSRPSQDPLSVLIIDVDHFKRINDTFGHSAGDSVLRQVAARIAVTVREHDTAGRWGGEEFLIILPRTPVDEAVGIAERLLLAISDTPFEVGAGGDLLDVTVSIGCYGDSRSHPDVLVNVADRALYRAKRAGRNQVISQRAAPNSRVLT